MKNAYKTKVFLYKQDTTTIFLKTYGADRMSKFRTMILEIIRIFYKDDLEEKNNE